MRLLNIYTLNFEEFLGNDIPPYAILSHRWGSQEVSYKQFFKRIWGDRAGYEKIFNCCNFGTQRATTAATDEDDGWMHKTLSWVWIDTVCIDKRSSAELSEAINSMFHWYDGAAECWVHLADVPSLGTTSEGEIMRAFRKSNWFTRGWTLQVSNTTTAIIWSSLSYR